jgi:predicted N-formylglutamate amidohydrolase
MVSSAMEERVLYVSDDYRVRLTIGRQCLRSARGPALMTPSSSDDTAVKANADVGDEIRTCRTSRSYRQFEARTIERQ